LKDGENQVLAGLIKAEDRSSGSKVPGVGSLPILGRLFGTSQDSNDKTEVVLSITPHLVRNIQRPAATLSEFSAGTESSFRRRPDTSARAPAALPLRQPPLVAGGPAPMAAPAAPSPAAPSPTVPPPTVPPPTVEAEPVADPPAQDEQ
jgi:general secretion pathway protein D